MIKPYQKEYFSIKKKNNLKLLYHCCGNVYPILEELIEIGIDAINPVQISARGMEPAKLKKNYGDQITFFGGGYRYSKCLKFQRPRIFNQFYKRNN
jgi:uroporphyrinogen decarboxylase